MERILGPKSGVSQPPPGLSQISYLSQDVVCDSQTQDLSVDERSSTNIDFGVFRDEDLDLEPGKTKDILSREWYEAASAIDHSVDPIYHREILRDFLRRLAAFSRGGAGTKADLLGARVSMRPESERDQKTHGTNY